MNPEISRPWAQREARLASDACRDIDELQGECTVDQRKIRCVAFAKARRFVRQAANSGGVAAPVSESFPRKKIPEHPTSRVDIEVRSGVAFVEPPVGGAE